VDYLLVTLTHGFPNEPKPLFTGPKFAIENREIMGETQDVNTLAKVLNARANGVALNTTSGLKVISNFHLLTFIHSLGILAKVCFALLLLYGAQLIDHLGRRSASLQSCR
jgi:nuclear protein localization family protein 4